MQTATVQFKPEIREVLGKVGDNLGEAVRLLRENAELLRGLRELPALECVPDGALDFVHGVLGPGGVTL
jgi:hypothetical protein